MSTSSCIRVTPRPPYQHRPSSSALILQYRFTAENFTNSEAEVLLSEIIRSKYFCRLILTFATAATRGLKLKLKKKKVGGLSELKVGERGAALKGDTTLVNSPTDYFIVVI